MSSELIKEPFVVDFIRKTRGTTIQLTGNQTVELAEWLDMLDAKRKISELSDSKLEYISQQATSYINQAIDIALEQAISEIKDLTVCAGYMDSPREATDSG